MSRVLRRPMFRMGGPVDSYNTGIVSGLDDEGYADGGQIGGGVIYGNRMMDGRYGFQNPIDLEGILQKGLSDIEARERYVPPKTSKEIQEEYESEIQSPLFDPESLLGTGSYSERQMKRRQAMLDPTYKEAFLKKREQEEAQKLKIGEELGFKFDPEKFKKIAKDLNIPTTREEKLKQEYEERIKTLQDSIAKLQNIDPMEKQLKGIERFSDAYRKMGGYEDARSQAVYDFLGDIAPATASGKTKAEAFQEMLKAAQKSEAFKTPRNIKRDAAKLAIEREALISAQKAKGEGDISKIISQATAATGKEMLKSILGEQGSPVMYIGGLTASQILKSLDQNPSYTPPNARPGILYQTSDGRFFKVLQDPKSKRQTTEVYPPIGI